MRSCLTAVALLFAVFLSTTIPASAGEIKIGVAEALTGPIAKYGVPIRNGFALAAEEINAAGGINGSPAHPGDRR